VFGKNTIAIMQQVFVPILQPDGLTQLLQRPQGTQARSNTPDNTIRRTVLGANSQHFVGR
jgi:hypothetical protein